MEIHQWPKGKTILKSILEYNLENKLLWGSLLDTNGEILNSDAEEAKNVNNRFRPIFETKQEHACRRQTLRE